MSGAIFDSHLHVWSSPEEAGKFPFAPEQDPPPALANGEACVQALIDIQNKSGVSGAMIVQPINFKFSHDYVREAMRAHPDRFAGCLLADPTEGGGGAAELSRLVKEENFRAVRFNPYLFPETKMTGEVGRAMYAEAGKLGIPVGFMCFKGLLFGEEGSTHADEIEALAAESPDTKFILDHAGFVKSTTGAEWQRLLALAKLPQAHIKLSAFFRCSEEGPPFADAVERAGLLVAAFGAERCMWGSDFPFVLLEEGGYDAAVHILDALALTEAERAFIMGGTLRRLLKWT